MENINLNEYVLSKDLQSSFSSKHMMLKFMDKYKVEVLKQWPKYRHWQKARRVSSEHVTSCGLQCCLLLSATWLYRLAQEFKEN